VTAATRQRDSIQVIFVMTSAFAHNLRIRVPKWIISWSLLIADIFAGGCAFYLVIYPLHSGPESLVFPMVENFILITLIWSSLFFILGLYKATSEVSRFGEIQHATVGSFSCIVLLIFLDAVNILPLPYKPGIILNYWFVFILCFSVVRFSARSIQKAMIRKGIGLEKMIIVGHNPRGKKVAADVEKHPDFGYDLIGFVHIDGEEELDPGNGSLLGHDNNLKDIIIQHQIAHVVLAPNRSDHTKLMSLLTRANGAPTAIKIVPDLYEAISGMARTQQLYGLPLIRVNPELNTLYNRHGKRLLDLLIAVPAFILLLPFWALISLAIKIGSKGSILYKQERIGWKQRPFTIYKFRSMVQDAETDTGPVWASKDDSRITSVGRWLRRFRLDEIPQLINVIKGDMSLIGPRPERPSIIERLIQEYPFYYRRHSVRPGITGWAQIKHPYDQRIEDVREKLKYDFFYIESLTFNLDIKIILNTVWVMLSGKGR
jgi:exopolysaccharide biosynthesis polyprenyl glycosylphosphotransferase